MKVLFVCSYKEKQPHNMAPFIWEQANSLVKLGIEIDYFFVKRKGVKGYLSSINDYRATIQSFEPDIIHAHFGLCGLLANFQRKIPVITTYHGCDVQALGTNLFLSRISMALSRYNIFVSERMKAIVSYKRANSSVIPCGIVLDYFPVIPQREASNIMGWCESHKNIQFAGAFNSHVKNFSLAKEALPHDKHIEIKELSGLSREQVNLSLCAADCLLLTSIREGSPMIIKEAMACGCPIVSTNVGDVKDTLNNVTGSYVVDHPTPTNIAKALEAALNFQGRTNGRERLIELGLDSMSIAAKIKSIYDYIINERNN